MRFVKKSALFVAFILVVISCTNQSTDSQSDNTSSEELGVDSKVVINGVQYQIVETLTNGSQAHVYKASSPPRQDIVIKIPKNNGSPFAQKIFFESYANFTRENGQSSADLFYVVEQKKQNLRHKNKVIQVYVSDFVDGQSLDEFIKKSTSDLTEEMIYIAEKVGALYQAVHRLSVENQVFLSDISKLDNIIVTKDFGQLRIIDAIVFDYTMKRPDIIDFLNRTTRDPELLRRMYMHWGFSVIHTLTSQYSTYAHEMIDILYAYLSFFGGYGAIDINNFEEVLNRYIVPDADGRSLFKFSAELANSYARPPVTAEDKILQAIDDYRKFLDEYVQEDGQVNILKLERNLPRRLLCAGAR